MNDALQEQMNCTRCSGSGYEPRDAHGAWWAVCRGCGGSGLSRIERMRREQEERAQRYLGDAPDAWAARKPDTCEAVIAWVIFVVLVWLIAAAVFSIPYVLRWLASAPHQ